MAVIRIFSSVLLISFGLLQYSAAQPLPSPVIAAFDTTEGSENPLDAIPDSDIYLDRVRSVKLECWAPYPVQWTYTGNGDPEIQTETGSTSATEYTAMTTIGNVNEHQAGDYTCASIEDPGIRSHFYVFVPGPALFAPRSGRTVEIDSNLLIIPCTASSPYVNVRLNKISGPQLQREPVFDPRRGFFIEVDDKREAQGAYECTAEQDGSERTLEFHAKVLPAPEIVQEAPRNSSDPPCIPPCADNAKCVFTPRGSICQCLEPMSGDGYQFCGLLADTPAEIRTRDNLAECVSHYDCPAHLSCFADSTCRDPCLETIQGVECSRLGVCSVVDHYPRCACPEGMHASRKLGCVSHLEGEQIEPEPEAAPASGYQDSRDDHQHGYPYDTEHHQGADRQHGASNERQWDSYDQHRQPSEHSPDAYGHHGQPDGHSWDAYDQHRQPSEHSWDEYDQHRQASENLRRPVEYLEAASDHLREPAPTDDLMTSTDRSSASGPCKSHRDCPFELSCFVDGICRDPCKETINGLKCGENAICKTYDHNPICACPAGFHGDPLEGCYNL